MLPQMAFNGYILLKQICEYKFSAVLGVFGTFYSEKLVIFGPNLSKNLPELEKLHNFSS